MPITFRPDEHTASKLDGFAAGMNVSKTKAIQLAVEIAARLLEEVTRGSTVVVRHPGRRDVEMWLLPTGGTPPPGRGEGREGDK